VKEMTEDTDGRTARDLAEGSDRDNQGSRR
jgi:hypothetical protein